MVGLGCCCSSVTEMSCFIAVTIAICTYCPASLTPFRHLCAGSTILELCKAVLTGGADGAQASLQLAALTLEGIQAKVRRQAELGVQSNAMLDPMRSVQRPLTPDCLAACLPVARWGIGIVSLVYRRFNTHLDVHRSAYLSGQQTLFCPDQAHSRLTPECLATGLLLALARWAALPLMLCVVSESNLDHTQTCRTDLRQDQHTP